MKRGIKLGSSSTYLIPQVLQAIWDFNPNSVLDVGVGTGRYGLLIRDLLEYKMDRIFKESKWKRTIDGVEIHDHYIQEYHRQLYNNIFIGDARVIDVRDYDLILANDVIEHFTKDDGHKFIRKMLKCCKLMIMTTPYDYLPTAKNLDLDCEIHRSGWTETDFFDYKVAGLIKPYPGLLMVVLKGELNEVKDDKKSR